MSDQTNARTLSRRQFGVMVVAGAAATAVVGQEVQQPNAASTRLARDLSGNRLCRTRRHSTGRWSSLVETLRRRCTLSQ